MEGITVLYQEPIFKTFGMNGNIMKALTILAVCLMIGALISTICMSLKGIIIFSILGVISIISISFLDSYPTEEIDHYEYKVTIEDSVSMKEFLSKYEIINQEGEIFTIVERENENEESK